MKTNFDDCAGLANYAAIDMGSLVEVVGVRFTTLDGCKVALSNAIPVDGGRIRAAFAFENSTCVESEMQALVAHAAQADYADFTDAARAALDQSLALRLFRADQVMAELHIPALSSIEVDPGSPADRTALH